MSSITGLLKHRGFASLLVTQFSGALNDNIFRTTVSLAALTASPASRSTLVAAAGAVFVLPYLLFSTYAGWVADRFSKRRVIVLAKAAEIGLMALGLAASVAGHVPSLLAVLFMMGAQSALISPARLGIIPELVPERDLSRANGLMELATFISIILGVVFGGALFAAAGARSSLPGAIMIGVAILGTACSLGVVRVPASGSRRPFRINFLAEAFADFRAIAARRPLLLTVLGVAWFWFLGMVFQLNVLVYGRDLMKLDDRGVTLLNACVSIGIGVGALIAGRLSGDMVELGLVPLGSIGLGLFAIELGIAHTSLIHAAVIHALLGVSAGFYIVPLDAYLQQRSAPEERGRIIASSNFLAFTGVILGSGWIALTGGLLGWNPATVVLVTGILALAATAYILWLLPDFFVRLLLWLLAHTVYMITVRGRENIPRSGGALLVCNHISFVDAFLVGGCTQRFVRFLMYRPIYEARGFHWFFRLMGCIPVSETDGRKGVTESLRAARDRLESGELVCIFAEGSISRTGNLLKFRKGFESIVKGTDVPVIPMHLDGVWGSIFSYQGGRFLWKWPRRIPYPVTVSVGQPMPSTAEAWQVRQAIMALSADAFEERKSLQHPLHVGFLRAARRYPGRLCMADSNGRELTFRRALAASLALSRRLRTFTSPGEEMVGILLPASVPGALFNVALLMAGKVPVNLNFTTSADALESAIARCGIRTIVTSERFLEKIEMPRREGMVMAEEILGGMGAPGVMAKALHLVAAVLLPWRVLSLLCAGRMSKTAAMDRAATVIFSSGSTATPKGVVLTHHNIVSNVEGMQQIFDITTDDRMIGVLPFFHSFGFTATLWLPLLNGFGAVYHGNPMDARAVGKLCEKHKVTFLVATPTFLQAYLRRCEPEQFRHLRYVVVGAEKLKETLASAFKERFGIEPLEGYGATELSPAATMSMPDVEAPGIKQVGHKPGSIGQPIPGVAARIVDPETFVDRPVGEDGLLLIRGANVMKEYLKDPVRTAEVLRDGWYITGDIARFDPDGFLVLTDRLSRFAKIGGEMVPLSAVEEAIGDALGGADLRCVVTSRPDPEKGERLVVLHTEEALDAAALTGKLSASGLPNLWIPRRDAWHRVEVIPVLGSGKVDLKSVKEIASRLENPRA